MTTEMTQLDLSIVIPVLDEADSIGELLGEISLLREAGLLREAIEVIIVNDGSTDSTELEIGKARQKYPNLPIRLLMHNRNYGQTQALALGFQKSLGQVVVALDGDGQNDPADIPALLDMQREAGVDCVSGWRSRRYGDKILRNVFSRVANSILRKASGVAIHDFGCTLKAYRGDVIRQVQLMGDMHRIIPFQIEAMGGRTAEIQVNHRERFGGTSKYSLGRTFRVLQDIIVVYFVKRFMSRPMHLLGSLGSLSLLLGFVGLTTAVALKLLGIYDFVETPILLVSLIMVSGGLNVMGIGLIAEMLNRRTGHFSTLLYPLGGSEK